MPVIDFCTPILYSPPWWYSCITISPPDLCLKIFRRLELCDILRSFRDTIWAYTYCKVIVIGCIIFKNSVRWEIVSSISFQSENEQENYHSIWFYTGNKWKIQVNVLHFTVGGNKFKNGDRTLVIFTKKKMILFRTNVGTNRYFIKDHVIALNQTINVAKTFAAFNNTFTHIKMFVDGNLPRCPPLNNPFWKCEMSFRKSMV